MHKKPEGKKSLGFVVAATLFVLVALLLAFWSTKEDSQRQGITMPDSDFAETESPGDAVEPEALFLTVEPENIQEILETMARPEQYTQVFDVTSHWEDGSSESTVTIWRNGNLRKAQVVSTTGTKWFLTDGETLWTWYDGDQKSVSFDCDETISLDDLVGIPTYELLQNLPQADILQGRYIPASDDWTDNCLFITASQWAGGETGFWVDATSQILVASQVAQNGTLQQSVKQSQLSLEPIEATVFVTPEGTTLETETPQP